MRTNNQKKKPGIVWILPVILFLSFLQSCEKADTEVSKKTKPSTFSSETLQKWMTLQQRLMRNTAGPNHGFSRHFAYAGIAALESLEPGYHGKKELSAKWNGLTGLPTSLAKDYYYPANVNAAMATINRLFFPTANAVDKAAIDSLETALNKEFLTGQPAALISASNEYGNKVAIAVFNWAETDGYKKANEPYVAPVGVGLWKPIAPAVPATPYWGNNRPVVKGSQDGTKPADPITYSEEAHSPFYLQAKEVYDVSKTLTTEQKAIADFWKDVPGTTTPGHWLSVVRQTINQRGANLEEAAVVYALTGAAINDASIAIFKWKYTFNVVRPIHYIREVFGYTTWNTYIGTPSHPEYVSAHSSLSMAVAKVLDKYFPVAGTFTDRTYDYLGYAPRSFNNFAAMATEAGQSRLYAGIHYTPSINAGLVQGAKIADNILKK